VLIQTKGLKRVNDGEATVHMKSPSRLGPGLSSMAMLPAAEGSAGVNATLNRHSRRRTTARIANSQGL